MVGSDKCSKHGAGDSAFGPADRVAATRRPRTAGASAGPVAGKAAGQGPGVGGRARVRLTGSSQVLSKDGGGRGRPSLGEPDGALWARLTDRDRRILALVAEHGVLTTDQLAALAFPSRSRAQHRLLELARIGVLYRAQPFRTEGGSKPFHYLLGFRGAQLLAAQGAGTAPRPSVHADRIRRALESPTLAHLLGVNDFFAGLAAYTRRTGLGDGPGTAGGEGLRIWHSEKWVREYHRAPIRPDGYGLWIQHGQALGFFVEHDTGSEPLDRVADKLDAYTPSPDRYTSSRDTARLLDGMVLFWVASRRRETGLRKALMARHSLVPAATASRDFGAPDGPAGEVWSVVTAELEYACRVRLADLPLMIGGTEADGTPSRLAHLPDAYEIADDEAAEEPDWAEAEDYPVITDEEPDDYQTDYDTEPPPDPPIQPSPQRPWRRWRHTA